MFFFFGLYVDESMNVLLILSYLIRDEKNIENYLFAFDIYINHGVEINENSY